MKRIAIYNGNSGFGNTLVASLLSYWLEHEKKANVVFQTFDTDAGEDISEVVERESEGQGYYIMDFIGETRVPRAFTNFVRKGLIDNVIAPFTLERPSGAGALFTYAYLNNSNLYRDPDSKKPYLFGLWNRIEFSVLYDKQHRYLEHETVLNNFGLKVFSSRLRELPSLDFDEVIKRGFCMGFEEVKEWIDSPEDFKWQISWIKELENIKDLPWERQNWLLDKMFENGLHDGTFYLPAPIDPATGKPIVLPPDPSDEEAYEAFWNKDKS